MAWTVPNGCAYASVYPNWVTWTAGQSVPDSVAPNTMSYTGAGSGFVLVDFTNGYIYSTVSSLTLTISGNTFTTSGYAGYTNDVYIIASDRALSYRYLTLAGDAFTFGDGSNIRDKFTNSGWEYALTYGFYGRDDITSVTIPNGIGHPNDLMYAFTGCTNLQTVNGTLTQLSNATRAFSGCSSLTTLPTFPLNSTASFESAFYNCSSLTTAPTIPNGVTNIVNCFLRCSSLTTVPALPNTITNMQGAFMYCTALTTAPTIPSVVTNMQQCFDGCTSLVTASTIPASVTNTKWCFYNCAELTGAITIDASPADITGMFTGTVKEIVLFGTGSINSIANNYNNVYVWSLSQTMTAVRSTPTTTVDVSVDVSRYNVGNLVSLKLYKDNASTPLVVTWNDPTLAVTTNPTTFTTSVTGVADGDPTSFTIIATDIYGSANATTVNVPITFYTMDVQAGGKEIAFGTAADDDVTNYPNGLFKCAMDALFVSMVGEIKMWAGNSLPNGWHECDGSELLKDQYPMLYLAIGDLWGIASDNDHFVLPNLLGRVPVGYDSTDTAFNPVGKTDGEKEHKLVSGELPKISGSATIGWGDSSAAGTMVTGGSGVFSTIRDGTTYFNRASYSGAYNNKLSMSFGNDTPHNNLQPYAVVKYIICTGA